MGGQSPLHGFGVEQGQYDVSTTLLVLTVVALQVLALGLLGWSRVHSPGRAS